MSDKKAPPNRIGAVAALLALIAVAGVGAYMAGWFGGEPASGRRPQTANAPLSTATGPLRFDLQGHRGARGHAPENTLTGFHKALMMGVDTLELDLALTRDNVLVVTHDPRINPDIARWPDGEWLNEAGPAVRSLTMEEVKRFDVGRLNPESRYARMFPEQEPVDGERIPTLKEVVDLARAINRNVRFNIEIKINPTRAEETANAATFARAVVDFLHTEKLVDVATVQSFDYSALVEVRKLDRQLATSCLSIQRANFDNIKAGQPGPSPWTAGYDIDELGGSLPALARKIGCSVWSPHWRDIDVAKINAAHAEGLRVVPWTVNKPEDIAEVLALPVDGLITDYPDRARAEMKERGITSY